MGYCTYQGNKTPMTSPMVCQQAGGTWVTGNEPPPDDRNIAQKYWDNNSAGEMALDAALWAVPGAGVVRAAWNAPKLARGGKWLYDKLFRSQKVLKNKQGKKIPDYNRQGNKLEVDKKGNPVWARNSKGEIIKVKKRDANGKVILGKNGKPIMVNKQRSVPNWVRTLDAKGNPAFKHGPMSLSAAKLGTWGSVGGSLALDSMIETDTELANKQKQMDEFNKKLEKGNETFAAAKAEEEKKQAEELAKENMSFFDRAKLFANDPERMMQLGMLMDYYGKNTEDRGENPAVAMAEMRAEKDSGVTAAEYNLTKMSNKDLINLFTEEKSFWFDNPDDRKKKATQMLASYRTMEKMLINAGQDPTHSTIMAYLKQEFDTKKPEEEEIAYA